MVALALAALWVGAVLPRLIEQRSLIPDLLLAAMVGVRLFTTRADLFGSAAKSSALIGFGVAAIIIAYLWFQVRRLRGTATAE
jgi:predicted tellurium resistance membrane protein TerC